MKVVITGAAGFVGRNLLAELGRDSRYELLPIDVQDGPETLDAVLSVADFVFHLAGVNRPTDPADFDRGNRGLTEQMLDGLARHGRAVPVFLSSSVQAARENPYGASKRAAEDAVFAWEARTGGKALVYRLSNLFGKWCRPNYNSVVATFCHNIARDLPIEVSDPTRELELVYIDDLLAECKRALEGNPTPGEDGFCRVPVSHRVTLGTLADTLRAFRLSRTTQLLPPLDSDFQRALYGTYLSYLPTDDFAGYPEMKRDARGWLAELIKMPGFGQIFVSRTAPGITRGNHWHHTKVEKFIVVEGQAVIRFRPIGGGEVVEYAVAADPVAVVDIPAGYTHSITNTGTDDLVTLFWADEVFDPDRPDTYYEEVLRG